jgi:hypothetical protein
VPVLTAPECGARTLLGVGAFHSEKALAFLGGCWRMVAGITIDNGGLAF